VPVTSVVDGDTIRVRMPSGEEERVRYIGVDTPETNMDRECFGAQATAENIRLVEGRRVRLRFDAERRDRYGRLLAYVYRGSTFINAELLRRGFAQPLTVAPNVGHADEFTRLAGEARQAGRGLWSACEG
jgi:micrococcal nuclease